MNLKENYITVFTPVFNGEKTIHRTFNSLIQQSDLNFEWLIINDGSTDATLDVIENYKLSVQKFEISVYSQQNSGKHIALMKGIEMAKGELLLIADADDSFTPNTIDFFRKTWNELRSEEIFTKLSGISVLCYRGDEHNIIGNKFPYGVRFASALELNYKFNVKGEKWGVVRTDLLRQISFPEYNRKTSFLPEGILWYQLSKTHKIALYNRALRCYFDNEQGLMASGAKSITWKNVHFSFFYCRWLLSNFGIKIFYWNKRLFVHEITLPFRMLILKFLKEIIKDD